MSEELKSGGPAFPQSDLSAYNMGPDGIGDGMGMTLRDWFAGQAMVGLPALCAHDTLLNGETFEQHIARNAYKLADAMLAERERT